MSLQHPAPHTTSDSQKRSLWAKAFDRLSPEEKKFLPSSNDVERVDYVEEALRETRKSRDMHQGNKEFSFRGKRFVVRELAEKALVWIEKFKDIGDIVVQYDPVHMALPWAGIRLILQVCDL